MAKISLKLDEIIDAAALRRQLSDLTVPTGGDGSGVQVRPKVLALLKKTLADGRAATQALLMEDGGGAACAARLSHLMDETISALHAFACAHVCVRSNPSSAERMTVVATGGYGRGTLAPGSDIDLLFVLPYKQTPWGEQ
ncbi:MAG TPA: nucleotidyltransferase domain-containing protein, partial [Devosia sp.]|nr:nucleotidyltransferase domain-containing protein [Devosia sp.]